MSNEPTEVEVLSVDKRARDEVVNVLQTCWDSSEMNDESHPLHEDYIKAIDLAVRLLSA